MTLNIVEHATRKYTHLRLCDKGCIYTQPISCVNLTHNTCLLNYDYLREIHSIHTLIQLTTGWPTKHNYYCGVLI